MTSAVPRLVALDVDGTLLRSDFVLSTRTAAALASARAAGVTMAIASGRPFHAVGALVDHVDWVVSGNGTQVTHVTSGETPYEVTFPHADAVAFIAEARRRVAGIRFSLVTDAHIGWEEGFDAFVPADALPGERVSDVLAEVPGAEVFALSAYHAEMGPIALAPLLADVLPHIRAEYRGFHAVEVVPDGVDKAFALAWLTRHLTLDVADVWAFGDGINDIDMLRWAGRGVAMGNAHDTLLAVADEVTLTNDDDGVAVVLERVVAAIGHPRRNRSS